MPKYMYAATYTKEGLDGVRAEGAEARVGAIRSLIGSLGGTLESFYFAFGEVDAYVVVDLPDDETAAAIGLAVSGSGVVSARTVKLLTGEQVDLAMAKTVPYRAPGA
jgi:uncharacterized protein with GYD domain